MRYSKSGQQVRVDENRIFYTCFILVLAIAAFGLLIDILGRQ